MKRQVKFIKFKGLKDYMLVKTVNIPNNSDVCGYSIGPDLLGEFYDPESIKWISTKAPGQGVEIEFEWNEDYYD